MPSATVSKYERWLATMIAGPVFGIVLVAVDVEAGEADQFGPRRELQQVGGLEAQHLRDARGHVEVEHGPAPHRGEQLQPRVGVHRVRMPDG